MYKKSVVLNLGGYSIEYRRKEDLDLFLKMLVNGCKAINLREALLLYRTSQENLKRRKTLNNCIEYVLVMHKYLKIGYIGCVLVSQFLMFVLPNKLSGILSHIFLRKAPL